MPFFHCFSKIVPSVPDGKTVTPTDDVQILLACAGITNPSITTLSALFADTTTLLAVINSNNAIDYLVRSKSFACGSVPIMTSNTAPSGTCIQNGAESGYYAYMAFDGNDATSFITTAAIANAYVGYTFPSSKRIVKCKALIGTNTSASSTYTFKVQGSNNGSTWTDLADSFTVTLSNQGSTWVDIDLDGSNTYTSYRLIHATTLPTSRRMVVYTLQFYESDAVFAEDATAMSYIGANNYASNTLLADSDWCTAICNSTYFESVLNVKVPIMTSNTTPSGVCSASSSSSGYPPYYAFDGSISTNWAGTSNANQYVAYDFGRNVKVAKFFILPAAAGNTSYCRVKNYKIESSADGTNWTTEYTGTYTASNANGDTINITLKENRYWRCFVVNNYAGSSQQIAITTLQFYGREVA